jgi:GH25 family lysozyme M1 (1,4-beta-N-acetylmuramidase)
MPTPLVVDLSHHNPDPDFDTMALAGVVGVIHKATEGDGYVDPTLFERARAAMDAGLAWATYHFLRPGSMQQQIAFYLNTVDPKPGERVCLDHEDSGVSLDDLKEAVGILLADERNLQVTIYSGHVIKEQLGNSCDDYLAENTSLWIAQYCGEDDLEWPAATWPAWSLWQYTDKATVPGIDAPVDGDNWNGTREALLAWFGPAGEQPVPVLPQCVVDITVQCPEGVELVVTVNGSPVALLGMH